MPGVGDLPVLETVTDVLIVSEVLWPTLPVPCVDRESLLSLEMLVETLFVWVAVTSLVGCFDRVSVARDVWETVFSAVSDPDALSEGDDVRSNVFERRLRFAVTEEERASVEL